MYSKENLDKQDKDIANEIHYPQCWDTIAYPTLAIALREMLILWDVCPVCKKEPKCKNKNE